MPVIEKIRRSAKNLLPWRLRLFIQEQSGKGHIHIPRILRQHRDVQTYHKPFLEMLQRCNIGDFDDKCVCELGPGSFLDNAYLAYQLGANKSVLLDIENLADADALQNDTDNEVLAKAGIKALHSLPKPRANETRRQYLSRMNGIYMENGLDGYREVLSNSVDCVFSNVVVQHIRKRIFISTFQEIYRFMREGGIAYHTIDFKDMIGGQKNHLRFPDAIWEDETHYNMPMYTNRIQFSEMCKIFEQIGFSIIKEEKTYFTESPCPRKYLAKEFEDISDEDLMTEGAWIVLKKGI